MDFEHQMRYLSGETKGKVALVYGDGQWHVEAEFGQQRWIVPGTLQVTMEAAMTVAIVRWRNRSTVRPFLMA